MEKKTLLAKLEELYNKKEVKDGFPTADALIDWTNKVAPLLKFNKQYHNNFVLYAHKFHLPLSSFTLEPAFRIMTSQVSMAIEELRIEIESDHDKMDGITNTDFYIDEERIKELRMIPKKEFDFTKLIRILEELNQCYRASCYMATIMLVRALLDHIPPIFGCKLFSEVANNFRAQQKSFKESMDHLEKSSRKIADQHLHSQIRKSEVLPNKTQVNFRNDVDVLLMEIVRIMKK